MGRMPTNFSRALVVILASSFFSPIVAGAFQDTGLTAEQLAKIAKTKARAAKEQGVNGDTADAKPESASNDECGTIKIGNVTARRGIGGIGSSVKNETIVLGDVINIGACD